MTKTKDEVLTDLTNVKQELYDSQRQNQNKVSEILALRAIACTENIITHLRNQNVDLCPALESTLKTQINREIQGAFQNLTIK